jgi:hypothetical protein
MEISMAKVEVKVYKGEKDYEKDANRRIKDGWELEGTTATQGKVKVGRTALKAVTLLPWAVMRPSRKGDKITVTWVKR